MAKKNIIVIGASAGGYDALLKLLGGLQEDIDAAIFIVWHMSPEIKGFLPNAINKVTKLIAANATDREAITTGHIYVAPPDRHLIVEHGRMRITKGPKENRFRPAVDPLFRSAAYSYGPRVIGIILSGALDDGTAGLWAIKEQGGTAIVQDPNEAEVKSMPENALQQVNVDYCLPVSEMPELLYRLTQESAAVDNGNQTINPIMEREVQIATEGEAALTNVTPIGVPTNITCPECSGVLSAIIENDRVRYRCHTGHAFSADSLLASVGETIEKNLWQVVRSIKESIFLLNHIGDHFAEANNPRLAALYFNKSKEASKRVKLVQQALQTHEHMTTESIEYEAEKPKGSPVGSNE
ncbi:chemotaxis protein CheB [Danxiaibacter flavus]|uniref:protein-glutamate methylesterase n=1 Tax=Danxiaibacter flavus TaxID=3049108 RepID=A0ABV3ZIT7_9BACT|nr:chemotaxis protein CheB [Chitinophagaceae bacterium DXS]